MKIKEEKIDAITVIYAEGYLADEWGNETQNMLSPLIEDPDCKGMILDLEAVPYIDSSGLGIIVSIHKTLSKHSKKFVLSNINTSVKELLILTRLDNILLISKDVTSSIQLLTDI